MARIVVEGDEAASLRLHGEGPCVLHRLASPADPIGIFGGGVLGIVDQQVSASRHAVPRGPARRQREGWGPQRGLAIRQVGQRPAPAGDEAADRRVGVDDRIRADRQRTDGKGLGRHVVQRDSRAEIAQAHREEGRRQVSRQAFPKIHGRGMADPRCATRCPPGSTAQRSRSPAGGRGADGSATGRFGLGARAAPSRADGCRSRRRARGARRRCGPRRCPCCRRSGSCRGLDLRPIRAFPTAGPSPACHAEVSQKSATAPSRLPPWPCSGKAATSRVRIAPSRPVMSKRA